MYFSITVRNEYQRLETEIERLELEIAKFPAGELRAYKSGKRTKFYCRTEEGDYLYIKRADKDRLLKLARKGLYLAEKKDLLEQREYLRGLLDAPSGIAVTVASFFPTISSAVRSASSGEWTGIICRPRTISSGASDI